MCKEKNSIVYVYRMTHDYGLNPCCFNESFEPTPELLTLGGCEINIRTWINNNMWLEKGYDVYVMAVAAKESDDNGRFDPDGRTFIPEPEEIGYQGLIYAAKISDVMSRTDYLKSDIGKGRLDVKQYLEPNGCGNEPHGYGNETESKDEPVLLSNEFVYFGGVPYEIPKDRVVQYFNKFRTERDHRGRSYGDPSQPATFTARDELVKLAEEVINENKENPVVNYPYHPWGREVLWNLKGCN